jgi:hypothetical protein
MVPDHLKSEDVPCHHIALNPEGETIHTMERQRNQAEMEEAMKDWLRKEIDRLEKQRANAGTTDTAV